MRPVRDVARAILAAWWQSWRTTGEPEAGFVAKVEAIVDADRKDRDPFAPTPRTVRLEYPAKRQEPMADRAARFHAGRPGR